MLMISYEIIGLVYSLYFILMMFCYWHNRSHHSRNCYGLVSRNSSQLIWLLTFKNRVVCVVRIGARRDKLCSSILTLDGREFDWVNKVRYIVRSHKFNALSTKPNDPFTEQQIVFCQSW